MPRSAATSYVVFRFTRSGGSAFLAEIGGDSWAGPWDLSNRLSAKRARRLGSGHYEQPLHSVALLRKFKNFSPAPISNWARHENQSRHLNLVNPTIDLE